MVLSTDHILYISLTFASVTDKYPINYYEFTIPIV